MEESISEVLSGKSNCSCIRSDAIEFLNSLPDDSVDLLISSPPYENCRTYGLKDSLPSGEAWVAWMFAVVQAAAPKVKGLIAINCEGQTRGYRYSMTPFLLAADLHRAGFNLRKPVVFHRVGIPGSGGPDWLRNDWEPVICATRPGQLPWSDNTACGHPPKWAPGGEMSHRLTDGKRRTQWGGSEKSGNHNGKNGKTTFTRPSHRIHTKRQANGEMREQGHNVPVLANPGNVVKCSVGGGQMGHALAHENEAPFPLELPTFFVKSFAPPGGVVCDPFFGSGTTMEAAIGNGRTFIGCDIRESQRRIARRRLKTITPDMFAMAAS